MHANSEFLPEHEGSIEKLASLLKDIKFTMFTTREGSGRLVSRPMATQSVEFDGELWFFTRKSSSLCAEIWLNPQVNLGYASPSSNRYVSVCGRADQVNDGAKIKELWNPILRAWFPDGLEDPELTLVKVTVDSAQYWDTPSSKVVQLVGFAKAFLTGEPYKPGLAGHGTVTMDQGSSRTV